MLHFVAWDRASDAEQSILVDLPDDEARKKEMIAALGRRPPTRVVALDPGAIVLELDFDEDDAPICVPTDETAGVLIALEDGPAATQAAGESSSALVCGDEAVDERTGAILPCVLAPDHEGDHLSADGSTWGDEDEDDDDLDDDEDGP